MAQFVLKIEKLSHVMGPHGSQDLRSLSPIMAPENTTKNSRASHKESKPWSSQGEREVFLHVYTNDKILIICAVLTLFFSSLFFFIGSCQR